MNCKNQGSSLKKFFIPWTTVKAINWIIVIGLLVYCNSLLNGFAGDDSGQIVTNIFVHSLANIAHFFSGSTFYSNAEGNFGMYYKPMMMIVYSLLYTLFGPTPFVYHLLQLLFHIVNTCLLLLFFSRFFDKKVSFLLAILFLIHPINNETVVYIANLQDVLFTFFGLLALKFFIDKKSFILVGILLLLSLLSKESGIIFFPILILYYLLFSQKSKSKSLILILSLSTVIAIYLCMRIGIGNIGFQTKYLYMAQNATLLQRLFTIPSILTYYLRMVFFPVTIAYGWYWVVTRPTFENFGIPLLVAMMVFIIVLLPLYFLRMQKKQWKEYFFFLCVFIISLSMSLQLIPLDFTVADRWFYFPMVGLLGMFGTVITYFSQRTKNIQVKKLFVIFCVCIVVLLTCRTFVRTFNWSNNYTLCSHDEKINRNSYTLELCLGNEYRKLKEYNLAIYHLKRSIYLYPKFPMAVYYLGWTFQQEGKYDEAIHWYRKAENKN